jgi:hypothetical protein
MKRIGSDGMPLDDDPDPFEGYDTSSSSGAICQVCGALVPHMPDYAALHRDWHSQGH